MTWGEGSRNQSSSPHQQPTSSTAATRKSTRIWRSAGEAAAEEGEAAALLVGHPVVPGQGGHRQEAHRQEALPVARALQALPAADEARTFLHLPPVFPRNLPTRVPTRRPKKPPTRSSPARDAPPNPLIRAPDNVFLQILQYDRAPNLRQRSILRWRLHVRLQRRWSVAPRHRTLLPRRSGAGFLPRPLALRRLRVPLQPPLRLLQPNRAAEHFAPRPVSLWPV